MLFVCTGNTCRSPLASALLQARTDIAVEVKSAGVYALPNMPASDGTKVVLEEKGISITHQSQPLSEELLKWADLVLAMTQSHKQAISSMFPDSVSEHVYTLKEYIDPNACDIDISDPFGGSVDIYRQTAEEIERCLDEVVRKLGNK